MASFAATAGIGLVACDTAHTADGPASGEVAVQQNGHQLARLTLVQLQHLPQADIATPQSRGAKIQRGPTVRTVLAAAGAQRVHSVRVEGRDTPQTLAAAELTEKLILCVTKRQTLKLAGTDLGVERWVRDVSTLVVNP
ncbi:hypothetical protein PT015_15860 [Candidatus Mycobacterium wuenschmannii]|uniref:Uncharacterized protein n=1 Tax=Candidatus Mycobacterium wuenschmannii TaxID=3027808 RepID=A0ABY8VW27_9MYCO|nr:hypothetical protein [Candidatus Mycobacterium wuenschmannii]WIM86377.1 hypothetical protein PT015_15860 [Candidatus Mycobacterium wuenschmannii]